MRNTKGQAIHLTAICTLVTAMVGVGVLQLAMVIGGGHEVVNGVDAGALNVAKCAPQQKVKVRSFDPDERQFQDVADSKGEVGLEEINRVWGQALLINLNANEMANTNGSGTHADQMYLAAQRLNDRLAKQLKDQKNLHGYFNATASGYTVKMLGKATKIEKIAGNEWQTAYVDRGEQCNISISNDQLPSANDARNLNLLENNGKSWLRGYKNITVRGRQFMFVPMKEGKQPHQISGHTFADNKQAPRSLTMLADVVPNAFSVHGRVSTADAGTPPLEAKSFVKANPSKSFKAAIPNGFIRIKLTKNDLKVVFNGIQNEETDYGYAPKTIQTKWRWAPWPLGKVSARAFVGLNYIPPTLEKAVYAWKGSANYSPLTKTLMQRVKEINPDFTEKDLNSALSGCYVLPGVYDYVIYRSKDNKLKAATQYQAITQGLYTASIANPEGQEKSITKESKYAIAASPNTGFVSMRGVGEPVTSFVPIAIKEEGTLKWKAGSGYNGCLGELNIHRKTTQWYIGFFAI